MIYRGTKATQCHVGGGGGGGEGGRGRGREGEEENKNENENDKEWCDGGKTSGYGTLPGLS